MFQQFNPPIRSTLHWTTFPFVNYTDKTKLYNIVVRTSFRREVTVTAPFRGQAALSGSSTDAERAVGVCRQTRERLRDTCRDVRPLHRCSLTRLDRVDTCN